MHSKGMQLAVLISSRGGLGCIHMTELSIPILYHSHDSFIFSCVITACQHGARHVSPLFMLVSDGLDYQHNAVYMCVLSGPIEKPYQATSAIVQPPLGKYSHNNPLEVITRTFQNFQYHVQKHSWNAVKSY